MTLCACCLGFVFVWVFAKHTLKVVTVSSEIQMTQVWFNFLLLSQFFIRDCMRHNWIGFWRIFFSVGMLQFLYPQVNHRSLLNRHLLNLPSQHIHLLHLLPPHLLNWHSLPIRYPPTFWPNKIHQIPWSIAHWHKRVFRLTTDKIFPSPIESIVLFTVNWGQWVVSELGAEVVGLLFGLELFLVILF